LTLNFPLPVGMMRPRTGRRPSPHSPFVILLLYPDCNAAKLLLPFVKILIGPLKAPSQMPKDCSEGFSRVSHREADTPLFFFFHSSLFSSVFIQSPTRNYKYQMIFGTPFSFPLYLFVLYVVQVFLAPRLAHPFSVDPPASLFFSPHRQHKRHSAQEEITVV